MQQRYSTVFHTRSLSVKVFRFKANLQAAIALPTFPSRCAGQRGARMRFPEGKAALQRHTAAEIQPHLLPEQAGIKPIHLIQAPGDKYCGVKPDIHRPRSRILI
jgi:hypothetical protein